MMIISENATGRAARPIDLPTRYAMSWRPPAAGRDLDQRHLQHDDRAVDQQAEVDGPQRHQVAGHPQPDHPQDRHAHRQRDGRGGEQRPARAAQRDEQDHRDQHRALGQVDGDRLQHAVDELGAVVVRPDLDARRQLGLDLRQPGLDRLDHLARVGAAQHHDGAGDDLAFTVLGDGAETQGGPDPHRAQVLDQHWRSVGVRGDDRVLDVLEAVELAVGAHENDSGSSRCSRRRSRRCSARARPARRRATADSRPGAWDPAPPGTAWPRRPCR